VEEMAKERGEKRRRKRREEERRKFRIGKILGKLDLDSSVKTSISIDSPEDERLLLENMLGERA
jgi:hypothetical protein